VKTKVIDSPAPRRLERWLVVLIALHSIAVGAFLLGLTDWSVAFGGWIRAEPRFFAQQAGIFHIVVGIGYLYEYLRYRGVGLLLLAKSTAVVFLLAMTATGEGEAWVVPLSALVDGLMAAAVATTRRWSHRSVQAGTGPRL